MALPGNNANYYVYRLGERITREISQSLRTENGHKFLAMAPETCREVLAAVRNEICSRNNQLGFTIRHCGVSPVRLRNENLGDVLGAKRSRPFSLLQLLLSEKWSGRWDSNPNLQLGKLNSRSFILNIYKIAQKKCTCMGCIPCMHLPDLRVAAGRLRDGF